MSRDYQTSHEEVRRKVLVGGIGLTGVASILLLLIIFRVVTDRLEYAAIRGALETETPMEEPSVAPVKSPRFAGILYTDRETPCTLDRSASATVIRAGLERYQRTVNGSLTRTTVISLSKRTRFDVDSTRNGVAWGVVRSGRNTGAYCSVP